MLGRAIIAFLALPGVVAGVAPWLIAAGDPWRGNGAAMVGGAIYALGFLTVALCAVEFYRAGKGTLAPWSPPKALVTVGLYRWTRNPMYVGLLVAVAGAGVATGSPLLAVYTVLLAFLFHARVTTHEEPWLALRFPEAWRAYELDVPRWLPRVV
jgi:protein-S-isoprenylcysteine O-methyltransferase Ste14